MVRFARADGSKGSNKRVLEEPTPWSDMVNQMKETITEDNQIIDNDKKRKIEDGENETGLDIENGNNTQVKLGKKLKGKKKKKIIGTKTPVKESESESNEMKENMETGNLAIINLTPAKKTKKVKKLTGGKKKITGTKKSESNETKENVSNVTGKKVKSNGEAWIDIIYEESDKMTCYDDFWVKPDMVEKLDQLKKSLEGTMDEEMVSKAMKKAKKKAHVALSKALLNEQKKLLNPELYGGKRDRFLAQTSGKVGDLEVAWFDCCWVTVEGAERLKKLQAALIKKKVPKEELQEVMRKERRKEEKVLRREKKKLCLRCRKRGHMVRECPEAIAEYGEDERLCYTCGSAEHISSKCPKGKSETSFPHAKCFVCKKMGHISRQCPDNPRGLYPNGGSCRGCGSVEHLAANCSILQTEKEEETIKVGRIDGNAVESLDTELTGATKGLFSKPERFTKKDVKVVNF